ncbi:MAG: CoA-binding protein, partial [Pseudomonadota bacterium]
MPEEIRLAGTRGLFQPAAGECKGEESPVKDTVARRPLRSRAELRRLFDPASVCVVGASDKPGNFGKMTLENLAEFDGTLSAVNPRLTEVAG